MSIRDTLESLRNDTIRIGDIRQCKNATIDKKYHMDYFADEIYEVIDMDQEAGIAGICTVQLDCEFYPRYWDMSSIGYHKLIRRAGENDEVS